jgi:hypothetical protein
MSDASTGRMSVFALRSLIGHVLLQNSLPSGTGMPAQQSSPSQHSSPFAQLPSMPTHSSPFVVDSSPFDVDSSPFDVDSSPFDVDSSPFDVSPFDVSPVDVPGSGPVLVLVPGRPVVGALVVAWLSLSLPTVVAAELVAIVVPPDPLESLVVCAAVVDPPALSVVLPPPPHAPRPTINNVCVIRRVMMSATLQHPRRNIAPRPTQAI